MPKSMQIGEINSRPGLAEHTIVDPTENCNAPHCCGPQAQAIHPLISNSVNEEKDVVVENEIFRLYDIILST